MLQSLNEVASNLYADDASIYKQHKDMQETDNVLNKEFTSLCEWLVDNKWSIYFFEVATKSILFTGGKTSIKLNIFCKDHLVKKHNYVYCLGRLLALDNNLNGESMALGILKKHYIQRAFLNSACNKVLCNTLIQPDFDYSCTAWYSLFSKA